MSKPVVAIIGKRASCSYCAKLYAVTKNGALQKLLPGADVVDADPAASQADFDKWRTAAKASGSIPIVAVFDGAGKLKGKFVGRADTVKPFTAGRVAEMVFALCADCEAEGDDFTAPPVIPSSGGCVVCSCGAAISYCPACGKKVCR